MAILREIPGVDVTVQVNCQDAVEYNDPHASEQETDADCPTSHKYIESVDDAEFSIRVVVTDKYAWGYLNHALEIQLSIDGQGFTGRLISFADLAAGLKVTTIKDAHIYDDTKRAWFRRSCKFAAISTVDDTKNDRVESDKKVAAQLGVIEVRLSRVHVVGTHKGVPHTSTTTLGDTKHEIAEKSLKGRAISHGATLSHGEKCHTPSYTHVNLIPGDRRHFAVYRFYYRSRDALKQEMIIPRGSSPENRTSGLPWAEIVRLARERLEQMHKVKEERKAGIKRKAEDVDRTGDQRQSLPAKRHEPVIIDLTDD